MADTERPFQWYPRGIVVTTKYGMVRLSVVSSTWVSTTVGDETGDAYVGTDSVPALVYRDQEYIGMVGFNVIDGKLIAATSGTTSLTQRPQWRDAPKSYAVAMVEAIREAVQAHLDANPELFREADIADTNNALRDAEQEETVAREALSGATEKVVKLRARLGELVASDGIAAEVEKREN